MKILGGRTEQHIIIGFGELACTACMYGPARFFDEYQNRFPHNYESEKITRKAVDMAENLKLY